MANHKIFTNVVDARYRIGKQIGVGSFGIVFEGIDLINQQQVAIKLEPCERKAPQLRNEYCTYQALVGCPGIPNTYYFGQEGMHNILVIDLLGPSLQDLFEHCNKKFTIKTVVMVGKQMLSRVQAIHEENLIHRDIKPENFLVGRPGSESANTIHIVDFGMAKQYRDPMTKQHILYRERKSLTGTARYMSINAHLRREQSRRDDLEALGYVFIYFLRGSLRWQGLKATSTEQKYAKIGAMKRTIPIEHICNGFPREFNRYLIYVRNLGFEDPPDYDYLRGLLTEALKSAGEVEDGAYDWMGLNNRRDQEVIGVSSSAVPQMHHLDIRPNTPTALMVHHQSTKRHPSAKQHHLKKLLPDPIAMQSVLERNLDRTASCQAQFQHSQTNLNQTQICVTASQNTNAQQMREEQEYQTESFMQKLSQILCCNPSHR